MTPADRKVRSDKLIDIENRARRRDRRIYGVPAGRVRDLQLWFIHQYGDYLPDDDAGREDFFILAHHVAMLNGDPVGNIMRYAGKWVPWMSREELEALLTQVLTNPRRWEADRLGVEVRLPNHVRSLLGIRTIGAADVSKAEREHQRLARKNTKRRKQPRTDYEGYSISKKKPWEAEAEPISRATWYRRRKDERGRTCLKENICDKSRRTLKKERKPIRSDGSGHTCLTDPGDGSETSETSPGAYTVGIIQGQTCLTAELSDEQL